MTRIKEKVVEMIQRMPDDDMFYVINILQNLEEMTARKDTEKEQAMAALDNDKFIDFEDCLQEQCAVEEVADYIVTRNPDDFIESVQVITKKQQVHGPAFCH